IDVAEIDELIASDIDFLPRFKVGICLLLEKLGANHSYCQHHQSKVNDVAPIALPVAINQHVDRQWVRFSMAVPHAHAAPDFVKDGDGSERTDGESDIGQDVANASQRQYRGTGCRCQCGNTEVAP